ncbi:MAG: hypothetical protein V3U92_09790 [Cellulophaga sp.]
MKLKLLFLIIAISFSGLVHSQIKIGDNPQNLDANAVLELESTSRVLIITRITTAQMNAITPPHGALIYNTDVACVFYHNGSQWLNMCDGLSNSSNISLVKNSDSSYTFTHANGNTTIIEIPEKTFTSVDETITITSSGNTIDLDVADSGIKSEHIASGNINSTHIQPKSITMGNMGIESVGSVEIENNTIKTEDIAPGTANTILTTNLSGVVEWANNTNTASITGTPNALFHADASGNLTEIKDSSGNADVVYISGVNNMGIGTDNPQNKLHVAGAIRTEGILNSDGTANEPSYRFHDDSNTGLFSPAADQIGLSVDGQVAINLKHTGVNGLEIIANGSVELKEQLIDETGATGTAGQVLSATTTGTEWTNAPNPFLAYGKINEANSITSFGIQSLAKFSTGRYQITFTSTASSADYIIQLTLLSAGIGATIEVTSQLNNSFFVQISDSAGIPLDASWYFTVLDL